jgi:hypothetical protein
MGISIFIHDVEKTEDWEMPFEPEWWDSARHGSDSTFWLTVATGELAWESRKFEWKETWYGPPEEGVHAPGEETLYEDESGEIFHLKHKEDYLYRPIDFKAASAWIERHIEPDGNQSRLLEAMEKMQAEPSLWMTAPGYNSGPIDTIREYHPVDEWNKFGLFEITVYLGAILGVYLGARLGLQHSLFLAVAGGIVGAPVGIIGCLLLVLAVYVLAKLLVVAGYALAILFVSCRSLVPLFLPVDWFDKLLTTINKIWGKEKK